MARYIDSHEAIECIKFGRKFGFTPEQSIARTPTAAAVPVKDLLQLRDRFYEYDSISVETLKALKALNQLISKYEAATMEVEYDGRAE